jgi:hypothetical protein
VTLKLCRRCWGEWKSAEARRVVLNLVYAFLATGYEEAAPRQIREDLTD